MNVKSSLAVLLVAAFLCAPETLLSQLLPIRADEDPCGYPDTSSQIYRSAALQNWGYGYDSLRADLSRWSQSPYVLVDSVGATVQNRAIYMMTIQAASTPSYPRTRVWIHARTHPNEVQGTWVTNEMIKLLLSEWPIARQLRDSCVFNIIPMYNPDGVELQRPRQNANGIDIESNWSANPPQPEVQVLRRVLTQFMTLSNPIRIALNMHSSTDCKRYFVYHAATGTSNLFATMQQDFINRVRTRFPGGIEPYTFFVSWTSSPPPTVYPESWFWYNHREAVLANTYEDKNCASAGGFDTTAAAILTGIGEYLGVLGVSEVSLLRTSPGRFTLSQNYPNPFNPVTTIEFETANAGFTSLTVYDIAGREVATLVAEELRSGAYRVQWNADGLSSGTYMYRLRTPGFTGTRRMVVVR